MKLKRIVAVVAFFIVVAVIGLGLVGTGVPDAEQIQAKVPTSFDAPSEEELVLAGPWEDVEEFVHEDLMEPGNIPIGGGSR